MQMIYYCTIRLVVRRQNGKKIIKGIFIKPKTTDNGVTSQNIVLYNLKHKIVKQRGQ